MAVRLDGTTVEKMFKSSLLGITISNFSHNRAKL